jgi:hypothetical protein
MIQQIRNVMKSAATAGKPVFKLPEEPFVLLSRVTAPRIPLPARLAANFRRW